VPNKAKVKIGKGNLKNSCLVNLRKVIEINHPNNA
jgi:hypothetical protein